VYGTVRRRRRLAARPALRTSTRADRGGGAAMTARNSDPVQSTRGLATNLKLYIISLISHYIAYFTYYTKYILFSLILFISFIFYISFLFAPA
jgi:hypothetical protein